MKEGQKKDPAILLKHILESIEFIDCELRNTSDCHSRESGNPGFIRFYWIPSQAGNDRKMNFVIQSYRELYERAFQKAVFEFCPSAGRGYTQIRNCR